MALGGCGVREPAIPGAAIRARAAVSAAPATNRLGRTVCAPYDDSRLAATSPAVAPGRRWTALAPPLRAHAPAGALACGARTPPCQPRPGATNAVGDRRRAGRYPQRS